MRAAASLKLDTEPIDKQAFSARRGNWFTLFLGMLWADFTVTFASPPDGMHNAVFQLKPRPWPFERGWAFQDVRMRQLFADLIADVEDVLRTGGYAVERSVVVVDFVPAIANLQELQVRHYFESNK
jgi:hypothetical protein